MSSFRRAFKALFLLTIGVSLTLFMKTAPEATKSFDEASYKCLVSAVYHESRGEPVKGKRAVLDVLEHRALKSGKSYCEVVAERQQFPWHKKKGLVELTPDVEAHYNEAIRHPKVLVNEKFVYFNRGPTFGTGCVKIGNHRFCKEK